MSIRVRIDAPQKCPTCGGKVLMFASGPMLDKLDTGAIIHRTCHHYNRETQQQCPQQYEVRYVTGQDNYPSGKPAYRAYPVTYTELGLLTGKRFSPPEYG